MQKIQEVGSNPVTLEPKTTRVTASIKIALLGNKKIVSSSGKSVLLKKVKWSKIIMKGLRRIRAAKRPERRQTVPINVTRLGEISPLWQHFQSLGQFLTGLFNICPNFEPNLEFFVPLGKFTL